MHHVTKSLTGHAGLQALDPAHKPVSLLVLTHDLTSEIIRYPQVLQVYCSPRSAARCSGSETIPAASIPAFVKPRISGCSVLVFCKYLRSQAQQQGILSSPSPQLSPHREVKNGAQASRKHTGGNEATPRNANPLRSDRTHAILPCVGHVLMLADPRSVRTDVSIVCKHCLGYKGEEGGMFKNTTSD